MLRETLGIMRELPRLHEISAVLIRHGLGDFVQRIGLAGLLERAGQLLRWGDAAESPESARLDPISLNHIVHLIRELNEALGLSSIVVTYDVKEALVVADYVYVIADGQVIGKGTPQEVRASESPYLKQFLNALPDGPVRFHFPGPPLEEDLRLTPPDQ